MKVTVRVDASLEIGTGHIMRCLTLTDVLRNHGAEVSFICRAHKGNLIHYVEKKGYVVFSLEPVQSKQKKTNIKLTKSESKALFHANWLGVSQEDDAKDCLSILERIKPCWLIVDHYAIDCHWEKQLKDYYKKIMVIDDLADRMHDCDVLLDQTYGRIDTDYTKFVPEDCRLLVGSQYALLRPEFAQWRDYSLKRRIYPSFKTLLITMGGVDPDNITGQILETLKLCKLPDDLRITVVMGISSPNYEAVKILASTLQNITRVKMNIQNMAELMANSDLAIGATGATTWERCCLGLPTISIVLAENQQMIAKNLESENAIWSIRRKNVDSGLKAIFSNLTLEDMKKISSNATYITDGTGTDKVTKELI